MQHDNRGSSRWQGLGALLAVTAMMATPVVVSATAVAEPTQVSAAAGSVAAPIGQQLGTPSERAFRTSTTLATVVIGAVALVVLWWYLVVRDRRDD
jgi:hypothetical protein